MRRSIWGGVAIAAVCIGIGGATAAQDLPKLPDTLTLSRSGDSPGTVTFLHISHMGDRPDCTRCHPKLFSIAKRPAGRAAPAGKITHANMEKGRQCGACHNGKAAFGFDDCTACHRQ